MQNSNRNQFGGLHSQKNTLAPYAMRDEATAGRRFKEEAHSYRSEYQRDRDRIVHTKAFRRLERKTQVFAPHYSDHFRNRLTHTIEVTQIARTISQVLGLNTDLAEVLALSHDIGHPPFGHEGEHVLDEIMKAFGSGFDHNLHALRIVEDFESKYPAFRGLNLTFEVREGIVKHSRDYSLEDRPYVDIKEYRPGELPVLEAQVIDLADEIAYNSADLDDGYASGLLKLDQIRSQVTLFDNLFGEVHSLYPEASEKLQVGETVRRLIDHLVTSLASHTRAELERCGIASVEDVRQRSSRLIGFGEETTRWNQQLKEFLKASLYDHRVLKQARESVRSLLRGLFDFYLNDPQQLPHRHFLRIDEVGIERVVCDYIAGMTDSFAQSSHRAIDS